MTERIFDPKLLLLLDMIARAGGAIDATDVKGSLLNYFCDDRETAKDTFNLAIDEGFIKTEFDSFFETSKARITPKGKAAVGLRRASVSEPRTLEAVLSSIMTAVNLHVGPDNMMPLRNKIRDHILELGPNINWDDINRRLLKALGETYGGPSLSRSDDGTEIVLYRWTDAPVGESILARGKTLLEVLNKVPR